MGHKTRFVSVYTGGLALLVLSWATMAAGIRGFDWLTTLEEVKQKETGKLVAEKAKGERVYLGYQVALLEESVTLQYTFDAICKQLNGADYFFSHKLDSKNFDLISKFLHHRYGDPHYSIRSQEDWTISWQTPAVSVRIEQGSCLGTSVFEDDQPPPIPEECLRDPKDTRCEIAKALQKARQKRCPAGRRTWIRYVTSKKPSCAVLREEREERKKVNKQREELKKHL